jgi:anti-sigma regulatory factor (Ser/Thr protein kinase)
VVEDDLVASAAYQPEPTAAAAARRFVRDTLQSWVVAGASAGEDGLVDDAVLLTSELVTNAVVHAGTPVQVTCKVTAGEVEVVVSDAHPNRLVPEPAGGEHGAAERTSGRGLLLPAALASAWGVTYGQAAKAVWFRLGATAPTGWRNGFTDGLDTGLTGLETELPGGTALAAAFGTAETAAGRSAADGVAPSPAADDITAAAGDPRYQELLSGVAESARTAVAADGSFVLMADEDGDLRLQAAAGTMPTAAGAAGHDPAAASERGPAASVRASLTSAPSVLTVPFIVDGRVTGLLAAVAARPGRFGEADAATLQRLADGCGPRLQRAWLDELERVRRGRIAALAQTRSLLTGHLNQQEIMTLAGVAAVPRLAPWCALLLPDGGAGLRPAYVRHADEASTDALSRLLGRACEKAPPTAPAGQRPGEGPGWRWRLPALPQDATSSPGPRAAPGTGEPGTGQSGTGLAGTELSGTAVAEAGWCFPIGQPGDARGLLVIGSHHGGRLPHEVTALASDLACRIGLALAGSAGLMTAPG